MKRKKSLAERVNHLFEVWPNPDTNREYTMRDVVEGIRARGGPSISASYLCELRNGRADNPTKKHLEALASFFNVSPAYFFDDDAAERIEQEMELLVSMRQSGVRELAMRAQGLSPQSIGGLLQMIEQVRKLEGLPQEGVGPAKPKRGRRWPKAENA